MGEEGEEAEKKLIENINNIVNFNLKKKYINKEKTLENKFYNFFINLKLFL